MHGSSTKLSIFCDVKNCAYIVVMHLSVVFNIFYIDYYSDEILAFFWLEIVPHHLTHKHAWYFMCWFWILQIRAFLSNILCTSLKTYIVGGQSVHALTFYRTFDIIFINLMSELSAFLVTRLWLISWKIMLQKILDMHLKGSAVKSILFFTWRLPCTLTGQNTS